MKTQILHIESHDDLHSLKDKLSAARSERVLMIWPTRGKIMEKKLDLHLLARHATQVGTQIALVTPPLRVIANAREYHIPVFTSTRVAQRTPWDNVGAKKRPNRPRRAKPLSELRQYLRKPPRPRVSNRVGRGLIFSVGLAAFLGITAALLPSAKIRLSPQTEVQSLSLQVSADPSFTKFNLNGSLPAQSLTITVEGRDSLSSSGSQTIPIDSALGEIALTNLTDQSLTIPAGTVIRTPDINGARFETTQDAQLPAEAGAAVSVPIKAVQPGADGNLPANTLVIIDGDLGLQAAANNPQPTAGGSQQNTPAPTPADFDLLKTRLLAALWQSAREEALAGGAQIMILNNDPLSSGILAETYSPAEPQPSVDLALQLQIEFEMLVIDIRELEALAKAVQDATLSPGFTALPGTLTLAALTEPEIDEQATARWDILIQREIYPEITSGAVSRLIAGKSPSQAGSMIQANFLLQNVPEIILFPNWWPLMPFINQRITVQASP